jgi:hypothetical protein
MLSSEPAGCRSNGDGYGTDVFTCVTCQWSTSFQYDEASDTYYYETRFWKREETAPPSSTSSQRVPDDARK